MTELEAISNVVVSTDGRGADQEVAACKERALVDVLQCIEQYLELQQQLAATLKSGHLNLARSKYALPPGTVGQQRYSGDMEASARVEVCEPSGSISSSDCFKLQALGPSHKTHKDSLGSSLSDAADRDSTCKQEHCQDDTATHAAAADHRSSNGPTSSPIQWFAAFPPHALKDAQSDFSAALRLAVDTANRIQQLRHRLDAMEHQSMLPLHAADAQSDTSDSLPATL